MRSVGWTLLYQYEHLLSQLDFALLSTLNRSKKISLSSRPLHPDPEWVDCTLSQKLNPGSSDRGPHRPWPLGDQPLFGLPSL
jgi:hypothetical protein